MSFEHLDDPAGFTPDPTFRASVEQRGRRLQVRRRLALAATSVVSSAALVTGVLVGYGAWRVGQVDRVDVELAAEPVTLGEPFNLLLIGTDGRSDPEITGSRSDTVIVVRVLPAERRIRLLSIPRDLVVEPSDGGEPGRINAVFANGGPQALVDTVEQELGIPLNGYAEVSFAGLVGLVDAGGGLSVSVPTEVRDDQTGLQLEPSACTTIDGDETLALVRSRHLEERSDGGWRADLSGDVGRAERQRTVLALALPQVLGGLDGLGGLDAALDVAADHLVLDSRLSLTTLASLGRWALDGPPPAVDGAMLPARPGLLGAAAVLVPAGDAAQAIRDMGGSPPDDLTVAPEVEEHGGDVAVAEPVRAVGACP